MRATSLHPHSGHEQLDDSGLIHMNGRIYDPELGRMLSPDPLVQVPEYSQNFNRYSYVMNNPLNLTDPTGFSWLSKVFHKIGSWLKENWRTVVSIVVGALLIWTGIGGTIFAGLYSGIAGSSIVGMSASAFYAGMGAVTGSIMGGLNAALAGGDLGDFLRGAAMGGIQGAIAGGILHGMEGNAVSFADKALHVAGHGVLGGASNVEMGGKFQDGFLSAAAGAAANWSGIYRATASTGVLGRTAIAGVIGGTASALGGGKFANGAYRSAFQHLLNAESPRLGARLTYYVKERILSFYNPENGDAAVFGMESGAADYRAGGRSTEEYPDMTNDPKYEGFGSITTTDARTME
jgi:RHS repeat-associated protein